MIEKRIFLLIGLFISIHLQGQENHYWFHNFGATSSLKGGIEVAGIRNVAAAYYNPGAMAFIDGEYFEGQADVVSFDALNIKNAGGEMINLDWTYGLRGSRSFSFIPRGQSTEWSIQSSWAHPSFTGAFLPDEDSKEISADGFSASWGISNLALGQPMVSTDDISAPTPGDFVDIEMAREGASATSMTATVRMVEPVDLYSLVDRSVKYGFLFIGFTFLAFLMFDVIGGARVASAEYLLSGAGLVLFFVMLLAFAEMIGFALAYLAASAAIIGLITSYSAAILKSWRRASVIGGLLVGLYALLYVLLNLEGLSLIIGSIMLFIALAGVMYATRNIDWSPENDDPVSEGFVSG